MCKRRHEDAVMIKDRDIDYILGLKHVVFLREINCCDDQCDQ